MSAAQTTSTDKSTDKAKGVTAKDKEAAKAKAPISRTAPWVDLPAGDTVPAEPRDKTVLKCALTLLRERGREGATLAEIKKSFDSIGLGHHDPKALLVWANKKRGWGFHMKKDGSEKIVLDTPKAK